MSEQTAPSHPAVITVQGHHTARYDAERATVSVSVSFDGAERALVLEAATATAAELTVELEELHAAAAGPVTRWSSDQVRVWSDRPWNSEGTQLPLVFHASVSLSARFRDFESLAAWVGRIATTEGVSVGWIAWDLTDARRAEVIDDVRRRAVEDAMAKARVYATAVGAGTPVVTAIADPGMLGDTGTTPGGGDHLMLAKAASPMMARDSGGSTLALTPEQIEVSATVDARFRA